MTPNTNVLLSELANGPKVPLQAGYYAVAQVTEVRGHSLKGTLLWRSTIQDFHEMGLDKIVTKDAVGERSSMMFQHQHQSVA